MANIGHRVGTLEGTAVGHTENTFLYSQENINDPNLHNCHQNAKTVFWKISEYNVILMKQSIFSKKKFKIINSL